MISLGLEFADLHLHKRAISGDNRSVAAELGPGDGGAAGTRRRMDNSSLQLIRDVGTKLSKHSRPTKDFIIKSLRVVFLL